MLDYTPRNIHNWIVLWNQGGIDALLPRPRSGRPRRRWMKKGKKGTVPYLGKHIRSNVAGAVNPSSGELCALIVSHMDSDMFQIFLDEFAKETKGREVMLILDNATWHKAKKLNWHHIQVKYLPPYSPDFNPIEVLWLIMKAEFFTDWIAKEQEQLENRIEQALKYFFEHKYEVESICSI